MNPWKALLFVLILSAGGALIYALLAHQTRSPLGPSLAPLFQLAGRTTQTLDRALTRAVAVDDLDEREFGEAIAAEFKAYATTDPAAQAYLDSLVRGLAPMAKKPFSYRVAILPWGEPNACALPGGQLAVTQGLLSTLRSEAELVAVLAHELGHVELGHCIQGFKFAAKAKGLGLEPLGKLADLAIALMLSHSFSKTQEDEADEYAFELLLESPYDTFGLAHAFGSLDRFSPEAPNRLSPRGVLRDYLSSHPPLSVRIDKFEQKAKAWAQGHPDTRRYVGKQNLKQRKSLFDKAQFQEEWR